MRSLLFSFSATILIFSCKKDNTNIAPTDYEEYIKCELDGRELIFSKSPENQSKFSNVHIYNEANGIDQLNLIRQTSDNSFRGSIYISGSRFHKQSIPYTIPFNLNNGIAEFSYVDLKAPISFQCQFCPTDTINYKGHNFEGFKISITDTANSYLKGNFEGGISTTNGKTMQVTKGVFNIKISRVTHL